MIRSRQNLLLSLAALLILAPLSVKGMADDAAENSRDEATKRSAEQFFEQKIRPLLAARCWECHGDKKQEAGLRLDSRDAIMKGSDAHPHLIDRQQVDQSLLLQVVSYQSEIKMPPNQPLAAADIQALKQWVADGIHWPANAGLPTTRNAAERVSLDRQSHWAFQPIARPAIPATQDRSWPATPLDSFILEGLEAVSLAPSPAAANAQWYRRAQFDLLGVPAEVDDLDAFLDDDRPDRFERTIDQQLASPRFGERWGRHWLDLARYADTKGYAFDKDRRYPFSYTYRDYVIRALNADLPLDDFLRQQLAADLLPSRDDAPTLAALGFLTTGRKFNNYQDDVDDKIDVVSRGLMGLTVSCARCHDHKYDAVPMDDYYSLYGVFASCQEPSDLPLIGPAAEAEAFAKYQEQLDSLTKKREQYLDEAHGSIVKETRDRIGDYLVRMITDLPDEELSRFAFFKSGKTPLRRKVMERWRGHLAAHGQANDPVWGPWNWLAALPAEAADRSFQDRAKELLESRWATPDGMAVHALVRETFSREIPESKAEIARIYGNLFAETLRVWTELGGNADATSKLEPPRQLLLTIIVGDQAPPDLPRGDIRNFLDRAERNKLTALEKEVDSFQATAPGAPPRAMVLKDNPTPHDPVVFLRGNPNRPGKAVPRQFIEVIAGADRKPFTQGSGRLELAEAVTAPANPLTRRVLVNRIWMYHFVEPLVSTPADFGIRCERPIHATLIDFLATSLLDRQWSMKQLHRQLVLSSTYRQSSVETSDGRAIDPENRRYWRMHRRRLEFESLRDAILCASGQLDRTIGGRAVEISKPPYSTRRSIYSFIDRQDLPNLFRVFDLASPDQSNERRPRTTVPQQALYLMNSPFIWEQAGKLAQRVTTANHDQAVHDIYRFALRRSPDGEELELARAFLSSHSDPTTARQELAQLLFMTNEFLFVD